MFSLSPFLINFLFTERGFRDGITYRKSLLRDWASARDVTQNMLWGHMNDFKLKAIGVFYFSLTS